MAVSSTSSSISIVWNKSNIQIVVILSLSLQIFLILFAPLRKKTVYRPIVFLLWLAYLMADSVAIFGIGLISHNNNLCACVVDVDKGIQAFWVSFLLSHLGGPDTITAFSLEDSSLWRRHMLTLIFQSIVAVYVFGKIFPSEKSLIIPTILIFLVAIIKNVERLQALKFSSLSKIRKSMLSQKKYSHAVDLTLLGELNVGDSNKEEPRLDESIVVKHGYYFFQIFKVFIGDLIFSSEERNLSRAYFQKVSAIDALRVISVELQFIYEMLHTKALAIRSMRSYFFRFIAFTDIVIAFVLFNRLKKHQLHPLDVEITYSLLLGGIALDVIALFMLVFSDWNVAEIKLYYKGSSQEHSFLNKLVSKMDHRRKPRFTTHEKPNVSVTYEVLNTPFIFRRWSESISSCNLFSEFLTKSWRNMHSNQSQGAKRIIFSFCKASDPGSSTHDGASVIANTKHVSKNPLIKKLWIFIFEEVRRKSKDVNDPITGRMIFDARGDVFLQSAMEEINCSRLLTFVTEVKYDLSILTWHIATEMWYNREEQGMSSTARKDEREFSKILSDYMMYLLFNQSNVVSAVGGIAQITSVKTLLEISTLIGGHAVDMNDLCERLYKVSSGTSNLTSPLGDGIKLAQEMEMLGEMKWKVMGGVWVEMLSYAAIHIKGNAHVLVLSKGGELLAFVWLLMTHFGCFYKPEWGIYHERFHTYQQPR
ncbi:uncharacterized protein LOC120292905 [Eucalyptus grandis]|uniref:uncharacterized protein LOC120292905 n=1 Tax=Eucalyptus grandis TaxID=71139 RepID=UPI00192EC159|nr:uncharacterized protein LOC120292905 [Eucalyptus grandis]